MERGRGEGGEGRKWGEGGREEEEESMARMMSFVAST